MFSYYGSKSKLSRYYPEPICDEIIEPFAGSAAYSLYGGRWKKRVYLYDTDPVIVGLWEYLIGVAPEEIVALPDVEYGQRIDSLGLTQEQMWLMGFCINRGSSQPKKTVQKFQSWNRKKLSIAENLHKIRHWTVKQASYLELDNRRATWFLDPPYKDAGKYYSRSKMDYDKYAKWAIGRNGQVIACDLTTADYLPFRELREFRGQLHKRSEGVFLLHNN